MSIMKSAQTVYNGRQLVLDEQSLITAVFLMAWRNKLHAN